LSVPWARTGKLHFEFLKQQIKTGDERRKGLAWYALLRCGYRKAYDHARVPLNMPPFKPLVLHDILMDVGIAGDYKPLHTEEPLYMVYEIELARRDTPMPGNPDFSDVVGRRDATFNPPERLPHKYPFGGGARRDLRHVPQAAASNDAARSGAGDAVEGLHAQEA
jgi:hypothetical protein